MSERYAAETNISSCHTGTLTARHVVDCLAVAFASGGGSLWYQSAGHLDQAIPLFEETLARRERVLGADHPDTRTSLNNLASARRSAEEPYQTTRLSEMTGNGC